MFDKRVSSLQQHLAADFRDDDINVHDSTVTDAVRALEKFGGKEPVRDAFRGHHIYPKAAIVHYIDREFQHDMAKHDLLNAQGDNENLTNVEDTDIPYFHDEGSDFAPVGSDDLKAIVADLTHSQDDPDTRPPDD